MQESEKDPCHNCLLIQSSKGCKKGANINITIQGRRVRFLKALKHEKVWVCKKSLIVIGQHKKLQDNSEVVRKRKR